MRTVEIFLKGERIAAHVRASGNHKHTTVSEHMPSSHRRYAGWTIERIRADARLIGPATAALCELILETRPHPEQGFRACLGIVRLAGPYGAERGRCVGQAPVHGLSEHGIVAVADREQEELSSQPRREFIDLHRAMGRMKLSLEQLLRLARRNSTKAMALQASVKRGTAKVRNRRFETTQAIVGCKPHASAVYDDQRLGRQIEDRRLTLLWPFACVFRRAHASPPGDGLGVHATPCGRRNG